MIPNKRNGQKQKDHLEEARAIRDIRMNAKIEIGEMATADPAQKERWKNL